MYSDTSRDGAQQAGEVGVGSYKVDLLDSTGTVVKSTSTGSDGTYSFTNLTPGSYSVRIADPSNPYGGVTQAYQSVKPDGSAGTSSGSVSVPRNTNVANVDFGLLKLKDGITIKKTGSAVDTDQDGAVDGAKYSFTVTNSGERALTGVKVNDSLLSAAGIGVTCDATDLAVGASTTCTSNSVYPFSTADYDRGYVDNTATSTGNNPDNTPVNSTPDTARVNAPKPATASLSGTVYGDSNRDGSQQSGEKGINAYHVDLLDSTGKTINSTTTDANGGYVFNGLQAGTYSVKITDPSNPYSGVSQAYKIVKTDGSAGTGSGDVPVAQGANVGGIDFGLIQPEAPTTTTPTGPTTTTDPTTPTGPTTTTDPTTPTGPTTTTDPTTPTGPTTTTTPTVPAVPGRISGRVYDDANDDGAWKNGEPGVQAWRVSLQDAKGNEVAAVNAGADGSYVFAQVAAGDYHVVIAKISDPWVGISQAYKNVKVDGSAGVDSGVITVAPGGEVTDVNFGLLRQASTTTPTTTPGTTPGQPGTTTTPGTTPGQPGTSTGTTTTTPGVPATTTTPGQPGTSTTPGTTHPTTPTGTPTTSSSSSSSSTPGKPGTSTPGHPGTSGTPGTTSPGKPGTPGTSTPTGGIPTASSTSTTHPGQPGHPGTPGTPGNPGLPGQPGDPGTPGTPGMPGNPANPANPVHPGGGQNIINTGNPGGGSSTMLPVVLGGALAAGGLLVIGLVWWRRRHTN